MSLYVCEDCGCVENTALGQYWSKDSGIYPKPYDGKKLCSECAAPLFIDGTKTGLGKWHGKFEKESLDSYLEKCPESELKHYRK